MAKKQKIMIQINANIIQSPNFSLEISEIEKRDKIMEQKINAHLADQLPQDWTYSFWKIFSPQIATITFKKPKKLSKSRLTEHYCWFPADIENTKNYENYLKKAFFEYLVALNYISEQDFERLWSEIQHQFYNLNS